MLAENGYLNLNTLWFALIGVLWIGFFFLEGFDFGVGTLLPFLAKDDTDRRVIINTIGPVWDGNEVWLLVAGGATFAAFPIWYAVLFSGFYLALFLVLAALIFRGVAFEFRGKASSETWRRWWDRALFWGSAVPALLFGVAFANMLRGVPIVDQEYVGGFLDLLNPYALVGGLTSLALFTLHGATYLTLKTDNGVRERARAAAKRIAPVAALLVFAFLGWTYWNAVHLHNDTGIVPGAIPIAAIVAVAVVEWLAREKLDGWAFLTTGLAIVLITATIFLNLYPRVMVSSLGDANDLTIWNASSTAKTLTVMSIVALIFTPIVLGYQGWTYHVFRKRLRREDIPAGAAMH